jgi:hypothetical protein
LIIRRTTLYQSALIAERHLTERVATGTVAENMNANPLGLRYSVRDYSSRTDPTERGFKVPTTETNLRMCIRHIDALTNWIKNDEGFEVKFTDLTQAEQLRIRRLLAMATDIAYNPIALPTATDRIRALPNPQERKLDSYVG